MEVVNPRFETGNVKAERIPSRKLNVNLGIGLEMGIEKNGKVVYPFQPCHSLSRWANRWLANAISTSITTNAPIIYSRLLMRDVGGTDRGWFDTHTVSRDDWWKYSQISFFHWIMGIGIGSSNQPWSYDQHELVSKKMEATTYTQKKDMTETDSSIYFEFQGIFDITESFNLYETALYGAWKFATEGWGKFLVSRDVLSTPIPVTPGDVISVVYRITVGTP